MDESALERYFDKFIANEADRDAEEDTEGEAGGEEVGGSQDLWKMDPDEDRIAEFCKMLPDELLDFYKEDTCNATEQNAESESRPGSAESSTPEDHTSPEPTVSVIQEPQFVPEIRNVLSTVKLGCTLDLHFIAHNAWNVEYRTKTLRAVIMKLREPQVTAMIFKKGNVVLTKAQSVEQSRRAGRIIARKVQKLGFPVRFLNFKIRSLMASCNTFPIRPEQVAGYPHCSYEPELFPAVFYRGGPAHISTAIFSNGKVTFTGAKSEAEIYKVLDAILPILSCCRRL